jgi:hypothetical protein
MSEKDDERLIPEQGSGQSPDAAPGGSGHLHGAASTPYRPAAPAETEPSYTGGTPAVWIGIAVVAALAVLALIFTNVFRQPEAAPKPEATPTETAAPLPEGVVAENVSPFDFERGNCFTDFTAVTQDATVVTCTTPHAAQLVGTFFYAEADPFPGADALNVKASEFCRALTLSPRVSELQNLTYPRGLPSERTWEAGDRRIDCFIQSRDGNVLTESLLID